MAELPDSEPHAAPKETKEEPLLAEHLKDSAKDVPELPKESAETAPGSKEKVPETAPEATPQAETKADPLVAQAASQPPKEETETPKEVPEEAPDPDEDDLSDLDGIHVLHASLQFLANKRTDVLDEFAAVNIKSAPTASGPGRPVSIAGASSTTAKAPEPASALPDDDAFAASLQAGMAELLGELESSPEMQKQFEELVKELGDGVAGINPAEGPEIPGSSSKALDPEAKETAAKAEASFQESIRATMERMSASNTAATSATQSGLPGPGASEDDFLAAMLREMEAGGEGMGAGGDEDFSKMLLGMMEQLTNKDILYDPMKELHDKFPAWLEANRTTVDKADLERYEEQQKLVGEIVGKFEETGYRDDRVDCREYIVDRMQKVSTSRFLI
jgi:peroxin-19